MFDVCRYDTFTNVQRWLEEVDIYSTYSDTVKMLVANKIDQTGDRVVSIDEGREFARANSMLYIETSAKTREGVEKAFNELVYKVSVCMLIVD